MVQHPYSAFVRARPRDLRILSRDTTRVKEGRPPMLRPFLLSTLVSSALLVWPSPATAQRGGAGTPRPGAEAAEDERERQGVERFVALLERSPRRGTALDRIYGYHVERGSLDAFLKTYQDRVA